MLSKFLDICVIHVTTLVLQCYVDLCEAPAGCQSRPAVRPLFPWTDLLRPFFAFGPYLGISFSVCISSSSSHAISCLHYSWPQFGHQSLSRTSPQLVLTRPLQLCGWCASALIICLLKPSHTWWGNSTHHSHLSTLSPSLTHSHALPVLFNLSESCNLGSHWKL